MNRAADTIHDFYVRMIGLKDQLALIEPMLVCADDSATSNTYRQETVLVQFPRALRSHFEHIRGMLLHRSPLPTVDVALSELLAEE